MSDPNEEHEGVTEEWSWVPPTHPLPSGPDVTWSPEPGRSGPSGQPGYDATGPDEWQTAADADPGIAPIDVPVAGPAAQTSPGPTGPAGLVPNRPGPTGPGGLVPHGPGPTAPGPGGMGPGGPAVPGGWVAGGQGGWVPGPPTGPYFYGYPPRRRGGVRAAVTAAAIVAAGAIGFGAGHLWNTGSASALNTGNTTLPSNGGEHYYDPYGNNGTNTNNGPSNVSAIATKVDPAVVDVNSTFGYQDASGSGTGIVLTSNGLILTNNHVIEGATKVSVTDVGNGKSYSATVVGYDSTHDVALLQLSNASGLTTASLADSAKITTGQGVVALGNAGGTGGTPSSAGGTVTGLNQSITASDELDGSSEQLTGLIATNADVQSGDSGGPLVNTSGQVVGMDTAASEGFSFNSSSGSQGFAIPINAAMTIASQIQSGTGTATVHIGATGFLGVFVQSSSNAVNGVPISGVVNGGAAEKAGLTAGDTITSLNGQAVSTGTSLTKMLVDHHPGDRVQVGYLDAAGRSHTATVTLTSGPPA